MPSIPQSAPHGTSATAAEPPQQRYGSALGLLASLFFLPDPHVE